MESIFEFKCIVAPNTKSNFKIDNLYTIALPWNPKYGFSNKKHAEAFQKKYSEMCTASYIEINMILNDAHQIYYRNISTILKNAKVFTANGDSSFHVLNDLNKFSHNFVIGSIRRMNKPEGTFYVGNKLIAYASMVQSFITTLSSELELSTELTFMKIKHEQLNVLKRLIFLFGVDDASASYDFPTAVKTASKEALIDLYFPFK